ncbi:hypothetical protein G7021_25915 [Pseudomonas carnis]|nr:MULTISPECIES: primase-helicase family protein [Pseudomonas]KRP86198.1 hypothetical protein TX25_27535 [Pseudomonas lactis]MBA1256094.1 hypothetical protein [Pseudomonas carnis]MBA1268949.1 hypothetical protein [Pseudomonas carnis]MCP9731950.1 DUF5906 domain-containing protein [Pseudomonas sp. GBPI_506]
MTQAATNTDNTHSNAVAAVKKRFIGVPSSTSNDKFMDLVTGTVQGGSGVLRAFYKQMGGTDTKASGAYLLACLDYSYGDGFEPNGPVFLPGGLVNTWKAHKVKYSGSKVTAEDASPFLEYMERMFNVEDERDFMLWWVAHAIRRPEQKIIATPVLRSRQGIGKTFMVGTLMRGIMGASADVCSLSDIVGTFQDALIGKTTLLCDECYVDKRRTTNVLKIYQSNETLMINRKGLPVVTVDNKLNLMIASNDFDPVYFESSDRRFFIPQFIEYKVNQAESQGFIGKFAHWLDCGGFQKVRDYLETVDLYKYSPYAPAIMTESKQARLGWSLEDKIAEQVGQMIERACVVNVSSIKACLSIDSQQPVSDRKVAAVLEQLGCISKRTDEGVLHITPDGVQRGFNKDTAPKSLKDELKKLNLGAF